MRTIIKSTPPDCLAKQKRSLDWYSFMESVCHVRLKRALRDEQHHLCCYCELEIDDTDCHVEHFEPQARSPKRRFDYANLGASCDGGQLEHCGRFKDDRHHNPGYAYDPARFAPPHAPTTTALFSYLLSGSIIPSQVDPAVARYMIGYLGLDCPRLRQRREAHAQNLIDTLGPQPDESLLTWAQAYYLGPNAQGELRQFYSLSRSILAP
ncbi:MAG: retron system putative HNH endonuclease [Myxococcota bacterium]|jgi:uncharacterized protein (TIGR02646 family)|nr:retron system putative HNH endonuclease [Myxococcota bacterium]